MSPSSLNIMVGSEKFDLLSARPLQLNWLVAACEGFPMEDVFVAGGCSLHRWLRDSDGEPTGYYRTGQFEYTNPNAPNWMYPILLRENISVLDTNRIRNGVWVREYAAFCGPHSITESIEHQQLDPSYILPADEAIYGETPLIAAARLYIMKACLEHNLTVVLPHDLR